MIKQFFRTLYYSLNPMELCKKHRLKKTIEKCYVQSKEWGKYNKEKEQWKELFYAVLKSGKIRASYFERLLCGFYSEPLILDKKANSFDSIDSPIVLVAEKDSIVYMKTFLPYYRKMGIKHFVVIDNNSSDGGQEYLKAQEDVTLFLAPYNFDGVKKAGWKLQALSYIGFNHWCLWLDSDEFLVYPNMEVINSVCSATG